MSAAKGDGEPRSGRLRPTRIAAGVVIVVFVGVLAWGLLTGSGSGVDTDLARGQAPRAPEFDLPLLQAGRLPTRLRGLASTLDRGRLALDSLDGRPVVFNVWASWCVPCREEAPVLERGWRRWGRRDVLFLGLNIQDVPQDARRFLREFAISYPSVREPSNRIARAYGSVGLPETYFISGRARIVGHVLGVVSTHQLNAGARAALSAHVLGTEQGGASRPQR